MVTEKSCNLSEYPYTEKTYTEKTCHYVILSHNTEWIKKFNITALLLIWERLKQWKKKKKVTFFDQVWQTKPFQLTLQNTSHIKKQRYI